MNHISGGEKLERYLREMAKKVTNPGTLHVGFLEGATYPDGTSVPLVAAVQEFGSAANGIPARPYFRTMVAEKSPAWGPATGHALRASDYDARAALQMMGPVIQGQLQESIVDFEGTPLADATVARKGFDTQLIDSSHMLNSVDYVVEKPA